MESQNVQTITQADIMNDAWLAMGVFALFVVALAVLAIWFVAVVMRTKEGAKVVTPPGAQTNVLSVTPLSTDECFHVLSMNRKELLDGWADHEADHFSKLVMDVITVLNARAVLICHGEIEDER